MLASAGSHPTLPPRPVRRQAVIVCAVLAYLAAVAAGVLEALSVAAATETAARTALTAGAGLVVPVAKGRLALGTWQGVYLCEHRDRGGARSLLVTLNGE